MDVMIRGKTDKYISATIYHNIFVSLKRKFLKSNPDKDEILEKIKNFLPLFFSLKKKFGEQIIISKTNKFIPSYSKKLFSDNYQLLKTSNQYTIRSIRTENIKPFWDDKCLEISKTLPIGSQKFYSFVSTNNSMFSSLINQRIISPIEKDKNLENKEVVRCRKIQIYPNKEQEEILRRWMGTASYVYNKIISSIKEDNEPSLTYNSLAKKYTGTSKEVKDWERETPTAIRQIAIKDLCTGLKAARTNFKKGNIRSYDLDFRSKKKGSRNIGIPKARIKIVDQLLYIYSTKYIKTGIKICDSKLPEKIYKECRIKEEKGRWYVLIPTLVSITSTNINSVCSLDPGIRNFQTIYNKERILKIRTKRNVLIRLHKNIDLLNSLKDKKRLKNNKYQRKVSKIYFRISNLIDDLQYRLIDYLTSLYSIILIPTFESQKMSETLGGRNNRRDLFALKHFTFKQRLKDKAEARGVKVIECTEEYTSKTCGKCGKINDKLGCCSIFICPFCNFKIDRDINGARNIMIKSIKEGLIPG